jgi:hypothetical protein
MIEMIGGPDRDRTDDLFHAMEARSQLRHRPTLRRTPSILADHRTFVNVRGNFSGISRCLKTIE